MPNNNSENSSSQKQNSCRIWWTYVVDEHISTDKFSFASVLDLVEQSIDQNLLRKEKAERKFTFTLGPIVEGNSIFVNWNSWTERLCMCDGHKKRNEINTLVRSISSLIVVVPVNSLFESFVCSLLVVGRLNELNRNRSLCLLWRTKSVMSILKRNFSLKRRIRKIVVEKFVVEQIIERRGWKETSSSSVELVEYFFGTTVEVKSFVVVSTRQREIRRISFD